jgi:hypothetical protein
MPERTGILEMVAGAGHSRCCFDAFGNHFEAQCTAMLIMAVTIAGSLSRLRQTPHTNDWSILRRWIGLFKYGLE